MQLATTKTSWIAVFWRHARLHPISTVCLVASCLFVLILLLPGIKNLITGQAENNLRYAFLGGMAGFLATAAGALPALFVKGIPQRLEDSLLGLAAGMMLAASAFSLLLPGLEAATQLTGSKPFGSGIVVLGMFIGVLLMLGLDAFTPHQHEKSGSFGVGHERFGRLWLFVFAIALHNLPEGMAIGVSFSQGDMSVGIPLTTAIALQDIPEGLAVALAVRSAGYSTWTAVGISAASGLLEPLGALLGVGLSSGAVLAYPIGLGLAAGAMIFVVSHEVIPETHRNGHQTPATLGLMAGFALMMFLDTSFG